MMTPRERLMLFMLCWLYDTLNDYISSSGSSDTVDEKMYKIKYSIKLWKKESNESS